MHLPTSAKLTLLLIVVATRTAWAGAALPAEIEVIGQALAGATIASPEGLGAAWYNPAALAGQRGLRLQLDGGVQYSPLSFQRADDPVSGARFAEVANQAPVNGSVFGAISYDFGVPNLAVCIAAYSPTAGHYAYPEQGPQRFNLVSADHFLFTVHAGVAYKISIVSVGVMLGDSIVGSNLKTTVSAALTNDVEDPAFAIPVNVSILDPFTPSFNVGVRVEPLPMLALGVSFQPPYDASMTGTAQITLPESLSFVAVEGDRVRVDVKMPYTLRAGVKLAPVAWLALDTAFVLQGFSRYKELRVSADIRLLDQALPPIVLDKSYRDVYAARLGVEAAPLAWLRLRAGAAYESSGVRAEVFDLAAPDTDKVWLTLGVGARFGPFGVNASYMHMFVAPVVTSSSTVNAAPLVDFSPAEPRVIGNGTYRFGLDVFHLGVSLALLERSP